MRSLLAYFWVDKPRVIYFVLCCCLVLLLAWKGKDLVAGKLRRYIVVPSMVLLVLLLNPVMAHLLVTRYEETRSLRFFWLVPVSLLLAAVTVRLVDLLPGRRQKLLAAAAVPLVLLGLSGGFVRLRNTWRNQFTNWYKVPQVVVELDDWIMNDGTDLEKTAVFPPKLDMWVRQYRPEIQLPYEWYKVNEDSEPALNLYGLISRTIAEGDKPVNLEEVEYWALQGGYNYIVLSTKDPRYGGFVEYEEVWRVDVDPQQDTDRYDWEYVVYRLKEGA